MSKKAALGVGDQVKIVPGHPWGGAIARIVAPSVIAGFAWRVELETVNPGHQAMVAACEVSRV